MDKFWKFMEEKRYGKMDGTTIILGDREADPGYWIYPMNQDLIGYLMEYLDEVFPTWKIESNDEGFRFIQMHTTESRYDWLISKINKLSIGEEEK